jgi:hypothetical protein
MQAAANKCWQEWVSNVHLQLLKCRETWGEGLGWGHLLEVLAKAFVRDRVSRSRTHSIWKGQGVQKQDPLRKLTYL